MRSSGFISDYVFAISVCDPMHNNGRVVRIDDQLKREVTMMKELTWAFVIESPELTSQQLGHRRAIREIFGYYSDALKREDWHKIPQRFRRQVERLQGGGLTATRIACDLICTLTDLQAVQLAHRLLGINPGSLTDYPG